MKVGWSTLFSNLGVRGHSSSSAKAVICMPHSCFTDGKRVEWPPEAANGVASKEEATTNGTNGLVKVSSDASSSSSGLKNFVKTKLVSESNVYHNSEMHHPSGVIKSNCQPYQQVIPKVKLRTDKILCRL